MRTPLLGSQLYAVTTILRPVVDDRVSTETSRPIQKQFYLCFPPRFTVHRIEGADADTDVQNTAGNPRQGRSFVADGADGRWAAICDQCQATGDRKLLIHCARWTLLNRFIATRLAPCPLTPNAIARPQIQDPLPTLPMPRRAPRRSPPQPTTSSFSVRAPSWMMGRPRGAGGRGAPSERVHVDSCMLNLYIRGRVLGPAAVAGTTHGTPVAIAKQRSRCVGGSGACCRSRWSRASARGGAPGGRNTAAAAAAALRLPAAAARCASCRAEVVVMEGPK